MNISLRRSAAPLLLAALTVPGWTSLSAQEPAPAGDAITVTGAVPPADLSGLTAGPEIEGQITARNGEQVQITGVKGTETVIVADATKIRASGGFLGMNRSKLTSESLLNGLPVTVKTVQWEGGLVASQISLKTSNLQTASMIRSGTAQRFGEHDTAIAQNAAATEALRGRVGDIDQYNVKATTNVHFATGKWGLTPDDESQLCATAAEAKAMDNALLLVVGYTDAVGDEEYNQQLSERRAGRVVNYLQQKCGWAPYRMLTPTGMAEADPLADNASATGKAQNRRVAVNILVSKAVDGL